jgi:hypothetical protein
VVGLRDQINRKPAVVAGAIGVLILLLICFTVFNLKKGQPSAVSGAQMYYTSDDGKTWFADAWEKVPPFDHGGAQAVRCYVFKTASSGPFAGYLETYTPAVHDRLTGVVQSPLPLDVPSGTLVKRPGDKNWVPMVSPAGQKITSVKPPDGSAGSAEALLP